MGRCRSYRIPYDPRNVPGWQTLDRDRRIRFKKRGCTEGECHIRRKSIHLRVSADKVNVLKLPFHTGSSHGSYTWSELRYTIDLFCTVIVRSVAYNVILFLQEIPKHGSHFLKKKIFLNVGPFF